MRTQVKGKHRTAGREPTPGMRRSTYWGFAAVLFVLGLLIYSPCLTGPFILDDYDLTETFSAVRLGELGPLIRSGRPLLYASYIANHRLTGFDPFSFHLTNILLHCLNAFLLWRFLAALLTADRVGGLLDSHWRQFVIYAVPLLFLTSPIQTESVAYISSRSEVLGATFYLSAMWVFAGPLRTKRPWMTAFLVMFLFAAAVTCKQDKLTLPLVILLMDYLILARRNFSLLRESWPTYALFGTGTVFGFAAVVVPFLFVKSAGVNLLWTEYLFTQFRMYFLYMRLLLVPFGLNLDWDIHPSASLWNQLSWLALIVLITLAGAAVYYRRRAPLTVFAGVFFFIVLAPTSSFVPLLDFATEHRLYIPSIGFFVVVAVALASAFDSSRPTAYLMLAAVVIIYSAGTFQRSRVWADELLLWQDTARKSPDKYRVQNWLGKAYFERKQYTAALRVWQKAEERVEPGSKEHGASLANLGVAHSSLQDYSRAVEYHKRAIDISPEVTQFWVNLATAQIQSGRHEEGWRSFQEAIEIDAIRPEIYLLRGQEYYRQGEYAKAVLDFRAAIELRAFPYKQAGPEDQTAQQYLRMAEEMLSRKQ